MEGLNITDFVISYLATAAWITVDSGENDEFTKDAKETAKMDCLTFISLVIAEFGAEDAHPLLTVQGNDLTSLTAHDFFLTRNGHGVGFWDRPEMYGGQENVDRLTAICQKMGGVDVLHIRGKKSKLIFN